ncbi:MarR family transcriptional regulator [Roseomonas sp. E05]|uniref:MarR family winged helix-turn-helix transcriptional regulator n=1 Tax=Roseomonas sp. E05 TaxID=3046310 RepID=UPI0024BB5B0E|nr:MarR family transcriptional regulator [Roseomonas sp. E05]MDJ0389901.1 MarR family transcriptional regulator [Roseomonas sp. E05]
MTQSPSCGRLEDNLCFAVYAANHAFTAAYKPLLEPLGLTYPQYLVLLILWEQEGRTVKEIGARLHLDSGTLTPLLKRMEANGLLRRQRDAEDERQVRISLTEKGASLRCQAASIRANLACSLNETEDALGALRDALAGLTGKLRGAGS